MDTTTQQVIIMLDRLREYQMRNSAALHEVIEKLDRIQRTLARHPPHKPQENAVLPLPKLLLYLRPLLQSGAQWAAGILAMSYVLKGGDLVTAVETLAKLF